MNDHTETIVFVEDRELVSARQTLNTLRIQLRSGKIDAAYFDEQLEKTDKLLGRVEDEHKLLKRTRRFEALYNLTRLIGSSLDVQIVLDQVMDAVIELTGAERGFLMLRNEDGGVSIVAARNLDQQTLFTEEKFAFSRTIVNRVLDSGEPVVTTNATEDPRFAEQVSIISRGLRSIMASPLRIRGQVTGVAYVDNRALANLFDKDDLAALETLTVQAAFAIENARLFAETDQALQQRVDELTQLRRIDQQLTETLDLQKTFMLTLEAACRLSGASMGHLGQIEGTPAAITQVVHYGIEHDDTQPIDIEVLFPQAREAYESGRTLMLHDPTRDYSVMIVPAKREQRVTSVIILRRSGYFTPEHQDLVERVVVRAAVAIENAQLYAAVQAADKAKSEFVGIVAHDLKVPMTSIIGYTDLALIDGKLEERQKMFLGKVKETVKRMEQLVADLADISRIEGGQFYVEPTIVPVGAIVQDIKDATLIEIRARQHAFVERVSPNLPDLYVDYYRLMQVLTNLLSNA
jgi:GAF domain-containing protein